MSNRKRDNQRKRVYDWERAHFALTIEPGGVDENGEPFMAKVTQKPYMEVADIRKLVTRVARDYGLSKFKPTITTHRCGASYRSWENTINLAAWARTKWVVLHELAHWLEWHRVIGKVAAHGREFVGLYMELLRRYDGQDLDSMARTANAASVDFMPNSQCTARYLKKHGRQP